MTFINATHTARPSGTGLWTSLKNLHGVWRQRQALKILDDRALTDIGISRTQAEAEARRAIWDAPETWRV